MNRAFRFLLIRVTKLSRDRQNSNESRSRGKELLRRYRLHMTPSIEFAPSTPDVSAAAARQERN